jgi:iron complex transport system ATP-binding protein
MLRAQGLCCARGRREVLNEVSLELRAGEVLGVLGANGAGKSTLLATLAGEIPATKGMLGLENRPLSAWQPAALARKRAVLPQSPSMSFDLPVHQVVAMGAYPFPEVSPNALLSLVEQALEAADAGLLHERRYASLSGGEQQRVQFARVLVQMLSAKRPEEYRVLLLDEPTASLDPLHQTTVLETVCRMTREHGIAALVVLHDVNLAAAWCDRLLLLAGGREVMLDTPTRALTSATLEAVYQLPARVLDHPDRPGEPLVLFEAGRRSVLKG